MYWGTICVIIYNLLISYRYLSVGSDMLVAYHVSFLVVRQIYFIKNQLEKIYEPMSICRHACEIKHKNARFSINIYFIHTWLDIDSPSISALFIIFEFSFSQKKRDKNWHPDGSILFWVTLLHLSINCRC